MSQLYSFAFLSWLMCFSLLVLDTAFRKLCDPEKRDELNTEMERQRAWDELNKSMSEDYKKMFEEFLTTIQCSQCQKRHKKTLVKYRTFYEARYCAECNTKHAANDGDIWAEVGLLGVNWTCYGCFGGEVNNIFLVKRSRSFKLRY